jgi:predicted RNase H-like nuclease
MDSNGTVGFKQSEVVSFDEALAFIEAERRPGNTCLVAVDQPRLFQTGRVADRSIAWQPR